MSFTVEFDRSTAFASEAFELRAAALGMSEIMVRQAMARGRAACRKGWEQCESPIEQMILPWLVFQDYGDSMPSPIEIHVPKENGELPPIELFIVPQFAFARYRMDFAIVYRADNLTRIVAVECDGRDFHDARRDDVRDDYLLGWGIQTIRASGSEIHAQPKAVAGRVAAHVIEWVQP